MEAGSALQGLAVVGELCASLGDDGLERFDVGEVLVDDGFVHDLPEVLGGLKLGGVGRKEEQAEPREPRGWARCASRRCRARER